MSDNFNEIAKNIMEIKNTVHSIIHDIERYDRQLLKDRIKKLENQQEEIIEQQKKIINKLGSIQE